MEKNRRPFINPYLAVGLAVLATAFSSIITKLSAAPPMVIAFYRLFFTVLILAPLALNSGNRKEMAGMDLRDLILAVLSGAFLALHFGAWITSLNYTSISSSTVLVAMQPLFVIAGGYLLPGEKLPGAAIAGAALAVAGSVLVGISDFRVGGKALYGDLLAFSGAFFVAAYVLIGRGLRRKLSLFTYVFIVYTASAVLLLAANMLAGFRLYPYPERDWLCFLALALVPTIMGHTVYNWALKYVRAAVVSVGILGEPVGATILAMIVFHQIPGSLQLAGGFVIIAGMFLFMFFSGEKS